MSALRGSAATFSRGTHYKLTFVGLGMVDLVLTLYAVSNGYYERNPVFASLQSNPMGLFMLKFAGPVAIAWLVPARLLVPSIALLFAVVGWNVAELLTR